MPVTQLDIRLHIWLSRCTSYEAQLTRCTTRWSESYPVVKLGGLKAPSCATGWSEATGCATGLLPGSRTGQSEHYLVLQLGSLKAIPVNASLLVVGQFPWIVCFLSTEEVELMYAQKLPFQSPVGKNSLQQGSSIRLCNSMTHCTTGCLGQQLGYTMAEHIHKSM